MVSFPVTSNPVIKVTVLFKGEYFETVHLSNCI